MRWRRPIAHEESIVRKCLQEQVPSAGNADQTTFDEAFVRTAGRACYELRRKLVYKKVAREIRNVHYRFIAPCLWAGIGGTAVGLVWPAPTPLAVAFAADVLGMFSLAMAAVAGISVGVMSAYALLGLPSKRTMAEFHRMMDHVEDRRNTLGSARCFVAQNLIVSYTNLTLAD